MRLYAFSSLVVFLLLLIGCVSTTGDIRGDRFYVAQDFSVGVLNDEWEVTRQKVNHMIAANAPIPRENTQWPISFSHKNSNGFIAARSYELNELGQARSLEVWADSIVAGSGGIKLSQRTIKVDGNDALELVTSGQYMMKQVILKKRKKFYKIVYSNSPAYFDQQLAVFDGFVGTFRFESVGP
jgi:hypothetical protein